MPKTKFESVIFTAITAWIRLHKSVYPKLSCHNGTAHTVISCRSIARALFRLIFRRTKNILTSFSFLCQLADYSV